MQSAVISQNRRDRTRQQLLNLVETEVESRLYPWLESELDDGLREYSQDLRHCYESLELSRK